MIDLEVFAWLIVLGIPILLWFGYWSIGFICPIFEWLRPKPRQPRQITLAPFMHDCYPYERQWVTPEDDSVYSEAEGYESSAEMDLEDEEDN